MYGLIFNNIHFTSSMLYRVIDDLCFLLMNNPLSEEEEEEEEEEDEWNTSGCVP